LVGGENGFNATESLSYIIEGLELSKGDIVEIEKMQGDSFAYFTVNGKTKDEVENNNIGFGASTTTNPEIDTEFQKAMPSDQQKLDILWKEHLKNNLPL
jgi:hypothetical protein